MMQKLQRPSASYSAKGSSLESKVAACVSELMNAGTSFHKLHLKLLIWWVVASWTPGNQK